MKMAIKFFLMISLLLFALDSSFAQIEPQHNDSLQLKSGNSKSEGHEKNQNLKETNTSQSGKTENGTKSQTIKQVKSARPDMSKARGARPPDIVRPNGSRIPKGVGRPAGAAIPGRK